MHDMHGKALHPGDKALYPDGKVHHIHGFITDNGHIQNAPHRGSVAFAREVELVEKHPDNEGLEPIPGDCIVWGNGPDPAPVGPPA